MAAVSWQATFEKIVALHALHPKCIDHLRHLACRSDVKQDDYLRSATRLDDILKMEKLPDDTALVEESLCDECRSIIGMARKFPRLLAQLKAAPAFQLPSRQVLATLLHLADLRPDPVAGMTTSDAPFVRILQYLNDAGTIDTTALLLDDLAHLIALAHQFPESAELLCQVAARPTWTTEMWAIERELDRRAEGQPDFVPDGLGTHAIALLNETRNPLVMTPPTTLASLLLQYPRFSSMTREEVLGFDHVRTGYRTDPKVSLFQSDFGDFSERSQYRWAAGELLKRPDWEVDRTNSETSLNLRITIANHFRTLRRIAKLDSLDRNWHDLYNLLENDPSSIFEKEDRFLQPAISIPAETKDDLWDRCLLDPRFRRLLQLRPRFRDIHPQEYEEYKIVSHQLPTAALKPAELQAGVAPAPTLSYTPLELKISLVPPASIPGSKPESPPEPGGETSDESIAFKLELLKPLEPLEPEKNPVSGSISLKWSEVLSELQALDSAQRGPAPAGLATRDLVGVARSVDLNEVLKRIGIKLYDWFFQAEVRNQFEGLLRRHLDFRIFLDLNQATLLQNLPWETLYIPSRETSVTLTRHTSLIRYYAAPSSTTPPPFTAPLRILVVLPAPVDLPPLDSGQEKQILRLTLSAAEQRGLVRLRFLEGPQASPGETQAAVRDFQPQIFQFVGHGHYDPSQGKGKLVFQEGTRGTFFESDKLANLLRDSMVGMAILNGCDTGRSSSNDSLSSIAAATVRAGVPAAIATMREVYDEAALMFTREFYRSFVGGYSLEASLVEARKSLYNGNWNWSAYALFSGVKPDLNFLRLTVPANRTTPNS